mgnify:CR=1 FL=1
MKFWFPEVVRTQLSSKLIRGVCIEEATNYYLDISDPSGNGDVDQFRENRVNNYDNQVLLGSKFKEKAEEVFRESRRSGYDEGYEEGYKEGLKKAEEEVVSLRAEAARILEQANNIYREKIISLQEDITALAVDIAKKILGAQLSLDPESVANIAVEAVQMMTNRENYTVYVNPGEANAFNVKRYELEKLLNDRARLQIIADPGVAAGGCLVETEQGMVDASLEARWAAMLETIYGRAE